MNLNQLYDSIRSRERMEKQEVHPGMHIGVIYPTSIHLIAVSKVGLGRNEPIIRHENGWEYYVATKDLVAVSEISPREPAMQWYEDGQVHLIKLMKVYRPIYSVLHLQDNKGVLENRIRAVWEPLSLPVVRVTAEEKRAVWKETPLEKLADDNLPGKITAQNEWYYRR